MLYCIVYNIYIGLTDPVVREWEGGDDLEMDSKHANIYPDIHDLINVYNYILAESNQGSFIIIIICQSMPRVYPLIINTFGHSRVFLVLKYMWSRSAYWGMWLDYVCS